MPNPTRFPAGLSTATKGSPLWNLPMPDPTKVIAYFNDFLTYNSGDFTVTAVGAGSVAASATEAGGAIVLTNAAADNDVQTVQTKAGGFTMSAGKKAWIAARLKVSDATQTDIVVGLTLQSDTDPSSSADGDGVTDGFFFMKDDGDTNWDLYVQKDATTGQKTTSAIATATTSYITLAAEFDGVQYVKYWVDGVHRGTVDLTSTPTTYIPDGALCVTIQCKNGEAVAKNLTVDYVLAAVER